MVDKLLDRDNQISVFKWFYKSKKTIPKNKTLLLKNRKIWKEPEGTSRNEKSETKVQGMLT